MYLLVIDNVQYGRVMDTNYCVLPSSSVKQIVAEVGLKVRPAAVEVVDIV